MFDLIDDGIFYILWFGGSVVAGFVGGICAIYWCRRDDE